MPLFEVSRDVDSEHEQRESDELLWKIRAQRIDRWANFSHTHTVDAFDK